MLDEKIRNIAPYVIEVSGIEDTKFISFVGFRLLIEDKINKIESEIMRIGVDKSGSEIATEYLGYIKARKELKDILKTLDKLS